MDITKDLKRVMDKEISANDILVDIRNQQKELWIKAHLFKVLSLTSKIEEAINDDLFQNTKIRFISIEFLHGSDDDDSKGYGVSFSLHDSNNSIIPRFKNPKINELFKQAFIEIKNIDINLTNQEELEKFHVFEVDNELQDKFLGLFLSKELKAIFDYNRMKIDLEKSDQNNPKKPKL